MVDLIVQQGSLFVVDLFDRRYAALAFEPAEGEHGDIHGEYGRRIEHGPVLDMQPVVHDARYLARYLAEHAFAYGHHGGARRAHVLLNAGVYQGIAVKIHLTAQDVGAHICDQGNVRFRGFLPLRTINGIVGGDVQVSGLLGYRELLGDVIVIAVFGAGGNIYITELFGFLDGFVGRDRS